MRSFLVAPENLDTVLDVLRLVVPLRTQGAVHCVALDEGILLAAATDDSSIVSVLASHELAKDYTPVDYQLDDDSDWVPWEEQMARTEAGRKLYQQIRSGFEPTLLHPRDNQSISKFGVKVSSAVIHAERFMVSNAPLVRSHVGDKFFAPAEVMLDVSVRTGNPRDSTYSIWIWARRADRDHHSAHFRGSLASLEDPEMFKAPSWLLPHVVALVEVTKGLFTEAGLTEVDS